MNIAQVTDAADLPADRRPSLGGHPLAGCGHGDELVAHAPLADDAPGGLRVPLQLLAQAADVDLQVVDLVGVSRPQTLARRVW